MKGEERWRGMKGRQEDGAGEWEERLVKVMEREEEGKEGVR